MGGTHEGVLRIVLGNICGKEGPPMTPMMVGGILCGQVVCGSHSYLVWEDHYGRIEVIDGLGDHFGTMPMHLQHDRSLYYFKVVPSMEAT